MATATSIIGRALGLLGIKDPQEAVAGADAASGLLVLNSLLDSWRLNSLTAYTLTRVSASVSSATATIGPAGTFAMTVRPERIELGSFFTFNGADYPVVPIDAPTYNEIITKSVTSSGPTVVYFDQNYPLGTLYFYPVPSPAVTVTLLVQTQLSEFADLTTDYDLPPGYQKALEYQLALELAPEYQVDPKPLLVKMAEGALRAVKRANSRAPILNIPGIITKPRFYRGWY